MGRLMYEVHPNKNGLWVLYHVGYGCRYIVAGFAEKEDANSVMKALNQQYATRQQSIFSTYAAYNKHLMQLPSLAEELV